MDQYEFWKMIFHSPVAIALASSVISSLLTFIATILVMKSNNKTRQNEIAYADKEKREERIFNLKNKTYDDFSKCFEVVFDQPISVYDQKMLAICIRMMLYAPFEVRISCKNFVDAHEKLAKAKNEVEKNIVWGELKVLANNLHTAMMQDIDTHK